MASRLAIPNFLNSFARGHLDSLQFSVDDLGHKGCISPTVSSIGTGSVPIIVTGVTSKLAIKAPGALYVLEDSVLAFTSNGCPPTKARSCSALQVKSTPIATKTQKFCRRREFRFE